MKRTLALSLLVLAGCGSQEQEPLRLARLVASRVPQAREVWQEAGQPNLLLRPGWPPVLFDPAKADPAVREVQVGVRYDDDQYRWTGFAVSLYHGQRVDYPQVAGAESSAPPFRDYDRRLRGFDSYALLDPEGGPYTDPVEEEEPGVWIWERRGGVGVRVEAEDGTPVTLFYDSLELEEQTALPKGAADAAKSAASSVGLDALLKALEGYGEVDPLLASPNLDERLRWQRDEEGLGDEELRAELAYLTREAPEALLAIEVSRVGEEGEFLVSQGRPVGIFLARWRREGAEPLPRAGQLLGRTRLGPWVVTSVKGTDGRRFADATTWFSWKDTPICLSVFVDLEK